jgi:hypothetical protein
MLILTLCNFIVVSFYSLNKVLIKTYKTYMNSVELYIFYKRFRPLFALIKQKHNQYIL